MNAIFERERDVVSVASYWELINRKGKAGRYADG